MPSFDRDMRYRAWQILFKENRFLASVGALALVMFITVVSQLVLAHLFAKYGLRDWFSFAVDSFRSFAENGSAPSLPAANARSRMTAATLFLLFIVGVFKGCERLATAKFGLSAVRSEKPREPFAAVLRGYATPFGAFALYVRQSILVLLAGLLFVIPGIVVAYRFRLAWYLKADHPEYPSTRCLQESARLMNGKKLRIFKYDMICLIPTVVFTIVMQLTVAAGGIISCLSILWAFVLFATLTYLAVAQSLPYEAIVKTAPSSDENINSN